MPGRGKRARGEWDPTKSDSEDETYGTSPPKAGKSRSNKTFSSQRARKKPRRRYASDDDDEIEESDISDNLSHEASEKEEEPVELGPNGRPRRNATKKAAPIIEDDDSEDTPEEDIIIEEEEVKITPTKKAPPPQRSLIVKLHFTPGKSPIATRRNTRNRSGSATNSRPTSSHIPAMTRRSSRIAHDETGTVALTNSGHHVEIVGGGPRSSVEPLARPTRGGKGIKKPATSIVPEEEEGENSAKSKELQSTDELQRDYQLEIPASQHEMEEEDEADEEAQVRSTAGDVDAEGDVGMAQLEAAAEEGPIIPESQDEDDEGPISQPQRKLRQRGQKTITTTEEEEAPTRTGGRSTRQARGTALGKRKTRSSQRATNQESSDFEPAPDEGEEEDVSDSDAARSSPRKHSRNDEDDSSSPRRSKRRKVNSRSRRSSDNSVELAEELEELQGDRPRRKKQLDILMEDRYKTRRQQNKNVNYNIMASNPALAQAIEDEEGEAPSQSSPSKRARGAGGAWARTLFSTYGPFGGAGGPPPVLGGPSAAGALAGADSDSSDDEVMQHPKPTGMGGTVGMTPTTAHAALFPAPGGQAHPADGAQAPTGTPANLGKVKDKQALADADPLGVDQNVTFDGVGGLGGHIDQLKEMVALPLLYPEVFQRFHVTPPRGVLFHGPPGTGKTLLARALASSVSSQGKKVTFYMRKGADALSKWVGEAERQLRLLFEEARKNQPSIIFFDEIDGLAPVRSSKQEQIHASIVSTLLALMDGMDGRGQVIVIGATNRPDSVDPALRRPGRFDREFYFPLPNTEARRAILDIHTSGWNPPLESGFKDEIARLTKGYGGADLRALCTEAALNAVQRRYPQIYKSNEKLQIKPETINVTAKDFMISVKKMVPSSERTASSGATPLPTQIESLLRQPLKDIENLVSEILPQKKVLTALQEAEFQDAEDDRGIRAERMQQEFERSRVFRPRLLVKGSPGMGQQYLAGALLNHFEGLHVQAFDLPTLLSDSTRSSEAAIVQLFTEVRRHKPSVIYIPNVDTWYRTVGQAVISTFVGLLRTLAPTDPVLVFGTVEGDEIDVDPQMLRDLFGFSRKCIFNVARPSSFSRHEYFQAIVAFLKVSPEEFPEPTNRQKRTFEVLMPVPFEPPPPPPPPTKAELAAQKKKDRLALNSLKMLIQPVMDQIKVKYRKFRLPIIDEKEIRYLWEEADPDIVTSDLPQEQRHQEYRPFEKSAGDHGELGLRETATGKFYYNLDVATIEKRLSNGYYKRPRHFTADVKKLAKDARMIGDEERLIKANELVTNVEVDMGLIEANQPVLVAELENVYARETKREREMVEKAKRRAAEQGQVLKSIPSNVPPEHADESSIQSSGPITLGQPLVNGLVRHPITPSIISLPSSNELTNRLSDLSDLHGHAHSNGVSVPSHGDGDVHMGNSDLGSVEKVMQGDSFGPSAQTRPLESYTGGPTSLQQRKSIPNSLTQGSAITPMAPGSQIADYTNYASTTSSDKRHTGSSADKATQSTPGAVALNLSEYPEGTDPNSQLPDTAAPTQGNHLPPFAPVGPTSLTRHQASQVSARPNSVPSNHSSPTDQLPSQRLSQTPAVPPFPRDTSKTNINSLLNDHPAPPRAGGTRTAATAAAPAPPAHPPLILDNEYAAQLLEDIVTDTSGYSVEQLEQVSSALMSEIWKTRGEWDRGRVAREVWRAFEDVRADINYMQGTAEGSGEFS